MTQIPVIDEKKCTGCGKCVAICPKKVLFLENKKAKTNENDCMMCSHCYAVCDFNAVSFTEMLNNVRIKTFKYKEKVLGSAEIDPGTLVNAFRSRRSIRKYKNDKVDNDAICDLLAFAVTAPSGSNCQKWEFTIINGRDKVWGFGNRLKDFFIKLNKFSANVLFRYLSVLFMGKTLINYYRDHYNTVDMAIKESEKGVDLLFHGAPCVIIIHGPIDSSTPVEDAAYASYNICMLAHFMNLGTCLIGFAVEALNRSPDIKKEYNITKDNRLYSVIAIGKPDIKFKRHSLRKKYPVDFIN
jgi:nitroreductase/NAD-dependent dihydropyrimidine dehydrogenase PreA subunit